MPWISYTVSGFRTKSEKIGCQLDGRVMSYSATKWMLERTGGSVWKCWDQRNQPWMKRCFGIGNPPILKLNLNTQVDALTSADTVLIFSYFSNRKTFLWSVCKKPNRSLCFSIFWLGTQKGQIWDMHWTHVFAKHVVKWNSEHRLNQLLALQLVGAPCYFIAIPPGLNKSMAMTLQWEPQRFLQDGSLFNNMFYLKVPAAVA